MQNYTSIGNASGEKAISLGSEAWNIADGFTKIKILRLLIELDLYETIAMFGFKDIDDPNINYDMIPRKRIEGIERIIFTLKQLIGNCRFSIDKGADSKIVSQFMERIENIENVIDGISRESYNQLTKEYEILINEEHFKKCFNILRDIKDELNFPINRAGLIFRQSDEIDLDKIMNEIYQGG